MKQLTEYKRNGLTWQLVARLVTAAIFKSQHGYEVIVIQSHNGRTIAAKDDKPEVYCEPAEYPPSNEQWGSKGFSYPLSDLAAAEAKMLELAQKTSSPIIG